MLSDIKESSRKLSIVLGGGLNHFNQYQAHLDTLSGRSGYFNPKLNVMLQGLRDYLSQRNQNQNQGYGRRRPGRGGARRSGEERREAEMSGDERDE